MPDDTAPTRVLPRRVGNEPTSGLYYEVLGPVGGHGPPVVFIHGGGATGAAFRYTIDGRAGWADLLASRGYECWVTDWPGTGRSGGEKHPLDLVYQDVVDGYLRLMEDVIGRPVVIVCHSMGGPATWAVVERSRASVQAVVSVGASGPGNIRLPPPEVLFDDGNIVRVKFGLTGVEFEIDRRRMYIYEDAYVFDQGIATSERFDRSLVPEFRAGLVGIPPRIVLQKIGVEAGFPVLAETSMFAGLPVRAVAGDRDPAHTRQVEMRTLATLAEWGAFTELVWLPDLGIVGNGHFLYTERNSDEVLEVIRQQIDLVSATPDRA